MRKRKPTPDVKPQNAVALVRLSDLRFEDLDEDGQAKGNVDQTQRIKTRARQMGWKVGRVIVENDLVRREDGSIKGVSAFKRRKITLPNGRKEWRTFRPGLRQAMELLVKGEHDGFIGLDLDRVFRDPRDLEDMIDIAEEYGIPVESVTGSLRLSSDADVTMARVMVAVANKESRDKSRRVSAARERQAQAGEYGGGRRPYGFDEDGVSIRPDECAVITDAAERLVQGASLRSLALDLRTRKVPTVTGAAWSAETLRDILLRPRNAGFMVYQEEEIGDAPWKDDAPVPVETFRAVQRILTDPDRRMGPGAAPKWVGTNIYLCGICTDEKFTSRTGVHVRLGGRSPAYRCKEFNHLVRQVAHVDKLVIATVLGRLAKADAVDLLTPARPEVDVAGLRSEAKAIRTNLNELAADKALGLIDRGQLITGTEKGKARLEQITAELQAAIVDSPLTPLIGAEDIEATWEALGLSHQRLVIDALVNVRILPSGRKGRGFDPSTVEITWKDAKPRRRK
jgi:site-specific DNA recombinase